MNTKYSRILVLFFTITLFLSSPLTNADYNTQGGEISATIPVGLYQIKDSVKGNEVWVTDYGRLLVPGKPNLPSKIFAVAIPPGAVLSEVNFEIGQGIVLSGKYEIPPSPLPRVIGPEDPLIYERDREMYQENYNSVYGSDDPYPSQVGEFVRTAGYRKYNLVDVRVNPFIYRPQSGQLTYHPEVTINLSYTFPRNFSSRDIVLDQLPRQEKIAEEIILNYDQAQTWYSGVSKIDEGFDFVIITKDLLLAAVDTLVDWETEKGRSVNVVTTSWIDSNYEGYDLAEKIRNFLREKYPSEEWGIEDLLLVGDYDDPPMRLTWQDLGYGMPETDYYYAELSLPDSLSWDINGNHQWGENDDLVDFYNEINVGRIPWGTHNIVLPICEKSVAYEQNNDPAFKKNILLLGAYFWDDTDNAVLMETKVDQPWMNNWFMTRMYEQGHSSYSSDYDLKFNNVKNIWSNGKFGFVNWAGHGSPYSAHILYSTGEGFVSTSTCPYLNDEYPSIVFADACSNSDTDYNNLGQAMIKQGAVGFLGATKVAYGQGAWDHPYDGSSQSLDYFFTTCVTSGDYTQGQAHQWALREMYTRGLWYMLKYETFEWGALWGNPDLKLDCTYLCGDCNYDLEVTIGDVVYLVNYVFRGGPTPVPLEAGEVNCDVDVNITDAVYLVNYLLKGGPPPQDTDDDGTPDC